MRKREGFTLIELLIVVAIIGILAAIAVPNFMNARVRAKMSRALADMKTLSTGVEQLRLDRGLLLVDFWDDDTEEGQQRLRDDFRGVGGSHNNRGGTAGIWAPLTSPVAYLSSIPVDPFFSPVLGDDVKSNLIAEDIIAPYAYMYADEDPKIPSDDIGLALYYGTPVGRRAGVQRLKEGEYVMIGAGPDMKRGGYDTTMGFPYEPSNGLNSRGDVVMRSQ
ncbi:MAG: prepilin-type N-terminal cleavage/methylation domain-containing protein [bacterium]